MKIAICDDEKPQRQLLEGYIRQWGQLSGTGIQLFSYASSEEFFFHLEDEGDYDLLILDIEMGEINGMELAAKLREKQMDVPILFVTGYEQYMSQGYDVGALHYLLKPVNKEKLFEILDRQKKNHPDETKFLVKTTEGERIFKAYDLMFAEAKGHYADLTMKGGRVVSSRMSISELGKILLTDRRFVACHRSYIINLEHVVAVTNVNVVMDGEIRLPISRGLKKSVSDAFIGFYHFHD